MEIIKNKPINNSVRHHIKIKKSLLSKNTRFLTNVLESKKCSFGRSNPSGKISAWHRQRGAKRLYRSKIINNNTGLYLNMFSNYDPNQTSFSSTVFNLFNKKFKNNISTSLLTPGALVQIKPKLSSFYLGFRMKIGHIPNGSLISNIDSLYSKKIALIKASGVVGQLDATNRARLELKLPSNKIIEVPFQAYATLGACTNERHSSICIGKAGRNRNLGIRPKVRGIAMNPVDHPHGGRANGGIPSVTPWGLPTKGGFYLKKRNRKKNNVKI